MIHPDVAQIQRIDRRTLLARLAALSAGAALMVPGGITALPARAARASPVAGGGLFQRGINYDVGTAFFPGTTTRPESHRAYLKQELRTIKEDLHASAVGIFGSDIDRLIEGVTTALDIGLDVRVQPRFIDAGADETARQTAELAKAIEGMNPSGGRSEIMLDLGCELTLFAADLIPGESFEERIAIFIDTLDQLPLYNQNLNAFLAQVNDAARAHFTGRLTYASGVWERVDWTGFDIIGVDLYRDAENQADYVELLRRYLELGKPLVISEFGCCCFEGADLRGGGGYDIIDYTKDVPEISGNYVRNETVQAEYLSDLLDIYEQEGVYGAYIYQFISPGDPHDPDNPRYDLDMASFALVKTYAGDAPKPYDTTGYWEPKEAFGVVAERFRAG